MKLGDLIKPKQYALEVLDMFLHKQCDLERTKFAYSQNEVFEAVKMSKEALEEVEQYRALGTVEELKEAMEKQVAKKIKVCKTPNTSFGKARTYYVCPNCGAKMCCDWKHCFECGQALKWGEEDE